MSYSKTKIATATRIIADKILNNDFVMWWISHDRQDTFITDFRLMCCFVNASLQQTSHVTVYLLAATQAVLIKLECIAQSLLVAPVSS